ncbi:MAG: hypothetical protein IIZ45_04210, partial [Firmicutes bacterium]|nr:hypothetical protein [Bacillota bacterium]
DRLRQEIAGLEQELDGISEQIDACAPGDYQLLMEFTEEKDRLEEKMLLLMEELEAVEKEEV